MKVLRLILFALLICTLGTGTASAKKKATHHHSHLHGHAAINTAHLGIPPGHLPPPGECRIWYPGRPPGHQPAPAPCALVRRRPAGAWLIYRPDPEHVRVSVISRSRPGIVIGVRLYEADTGLFIRFESR